MKRKSAKISALFLSLALIVTALPPVTRAHAASNNLIPNANFQTDADNNSVPDNWTLWTGSTDGWTGSATAAIQANDGVNLQISNAGDDSGNAWAVQYYNQDIPVTDGASYQLSFDIVSTKTKVVTLQLKDANNKNMIFEDASITLPAGEIQHITYHSTAASASSASLYFALGKQGSDAASLATDITISNISLVSTVLTPPVLNTKDGKNASEKFTVGESPVLTFSDDTNWRDSITSVKLNNKTLSADHYTFDVGTLTLDSSLFTKECTNTLLITATGYSNSGITLPVYDNAEWTLKWSDEFDGTSLDTSKWSYEHGIRAVNANGVTCPDYWGNNEKEYYVEDAATVADGNLTITAREITDADRAAHPDMDSTVKYTSARLRTVTDAGEKLATTKYGRIEASMKLPKGSGYWPAFWMLPSDSIYGAWAASGEIDIMEAIGQSPDHVNGTIHFGKQWPNNTSIGSTYYFPEGESTNNAFHEYAIEWEPGEMRWYVDDILYYVENNWYSKGNNATENFSYPAPFDEDFYVLLNLAVSGNYVSQQTPAAEDLPGEMKVDYVRIYDKVGGYNEAVTAPSAEADMDFYNTYQYIADANNGNYIVNPDFTTLNTTPIEDGATVVPELGNWNSVINPALSAAGSVATANQDGKNYAKFDITSGGNQTYAVQLIQHMPLAKGYSYEISFDAWSSKERNIIVAPSGDADQGWTKYSSGITAGLTTTPKTFTHTFTMTYTSDPTARLEMNLGNDTGTVYIGNVSVKQVELPPVDYNASKEPLENGEHIYNGGFDQGTGRMVYWNIDGATSDTSNRTMKTVISNTSSNIDSVKLYQKGLQLLQNDTYSLNFTALADAAKTIKVAFLSQDGTTVYAEKTYDLTTDSKNCTYEFTMPESVTDKNGQIMFYLGGNTTGVTLDQVSLTRLTNNNVDWSTYNLYPIGISDFNSSVLGWTVYDNNNYSTTPATTAKVDGKTVLAIPTSPSSADWHKMLQYTGAGLQNGVKYVLKYRMKSSANNQNVTVKIEDTNYSPTINHTENLSTEWKEYEYPFTSSLAGSGDLKFTLAGVSENCIIYVDDVSLEIKDAPYVVLNQTKSALEKGKSLQLVYTLESTLNTKNPSITWASSNESVATVSDSGLVKALSEGTATITATSTIGGYHASNSLTVTNSNPLPTTSPTTAPTSEPTTAPTIEPTIVPTTVPSTVPTVTPVPTPTVKPTPTTKPNTVTHVDTKSASNSITVTWNKIKGADGYEVALLKGSSTVLKKITTDNNFTFKNLPESTIYTIKVRAYDNRNNTKVYGSYSKIIKTATAPTDVDFKALTKVTGSSVKLTWSNQSKVSGYEVYMKSKKSSKYSRISTIKNAATITLKKTNLKAGTYTFKVRSYLLIGNEKIYSNFSTTKTVTIK